MLPSKKSLITAVVGILIVAVGAEATEGEKLSRLQGTARISRTRDVVGAAVLVQRTGDPNDFYLTSSNGEGKFFIDGLRDGEYSVRLNREGFAPETKQGIELKYPFRAVVEVTMEPGQANLAAAGAPPPAGSAPVGLQGAVLGPDGEGIGEVAVRIVRQDGSADPSELRTPANGRFAFDDLAPGEWRVEIIGIGYLPLRQRLMFAADSRVYVQLVRQPPDYVPSPLDLLPPEIPIAPEGLR
jgi:hypothetical protein